MQEVLKFFQDNPVFFFATTEGDQPRVRPFGFVMEYGGKLCLCTSNQKPVFQQMKANPKVEICGASSDGRWLRVCGTVSFIPDREAKEKALEILPMLQKMYSVDDGIFEVFALDNAVATFNSMMGETKTITF